MARAMLIVNPWSGMGKGLKVGQKVWGQRDEILTGTGKKLEMFESAESGDNSIFNLACLARREEYDDVFLVGGDGSISLAARALIGSETVLNIIPAGAGNDFSKGLLIPQDPIKALEAALSGEVIDLDVGLVDGEIFVNVISFGFDAKVAQSVPGLKKKYRLLPKDCLYLVSLLRGLFAAIDYPKIRISAEGQEFALEGKTKETLLLAFANGPRYGGIFYICPEARLNDGWLDVCWVGKMSRLGILRNFIKVAKGTHASLPEVEMLSGQSFVVSSPTDLFCQADGEMLASKKEYCISILAKALKVRAPLLERPTN